MHFLLVNDDGFDAPELALLCRAAAARGHRVTVVAPDTQQSARSHCFTIFSPLFAKQASMPGAASAWRVSGTPVDCTRLGMLALTEGEPVDLVISGINQGYNIGLATYVSGTVGAAREAAFAQGRALAVSMEPRTPDDMREYFADYAIRAAEVLVHAEVPPLSVCNLNAPCCSVKEMKGVRTCGLSKLMYKDGYERYDGPRGDISFWLKPMANYDEPAPGTDLALLIDNWLTVTWLTPEPCEQSEWEGILPER